MGIARYNVKKSSLTYSLLVLAVVLAAGCVGQTPAISQNALVIQTATAPVHINIEIADSDQERQLGLMGRTSLAQDAGMLFIFDDGLKTRNFWMKNTLIPLDIFFIADNKIVDVQIMVPCTADPCPIYASKAPADSALEVNVGFAAENGVNAGDTVSVLRKID